MIRPKLHDFNQTEHKRLLAMLNGATIAWMDRAEIEDGVLNIYVKPPREVLDGLVTDSTIEDFIG